MKNNDELLTFVGSKQKNEGSCIGEIPYVSITTRAKCKEGKTHLIQVIKKGTAFLLIDCVEGTKITMEELFTKDYTPFHVLEIINQRIGASFPAIEFLSAESNVFDFICESKFYQS